VGEKFDMSKLSLSVSFFGVINLIIMNASNVIIWPHGEELKQQKELFFAWQVFQMLLELPKQDTEVYVTRKCNYAITL